MTHRRAAVLLSACLSIAPAYAATLPEALRHWTGVTADVVGQGDAVRVSLPRESPVPEFSARARADTRAGDPGWRLADIVVPQPLHLRGGDTLTLRAQHTQAWLGDRTAEVQARYEGLSQRSGGHSFGLDLATLSVASLGGPVGLDLNLAGPHLDKPDYAAILPHEVSLRGHTTPTGADALAAMFGGREVPAGSIPSGAPVTIERLAFDVGPAQFTGTGAVTVLSPEQRRGQIDLVAQHFGDLTRQIQVSGADAKVFAVLMILRSVAHKQGSALAWSISFEGRQVLVNGLDVSVLMPG